jgi:3-oxoacyl-[acyl-carrier-protein] synthase III
VIGSTTDVRVSITGLGRFVPERVVTNEELARIVDTSDEWITTRTGIKERRWVAEDEALSDICLPAIEGALAAAGASPREIDLLIVATVTPDMLFPSTAATLADRIGAVEAAAYDLSAGCTGFVYALAQAYGMIAAGLNRKALVVGADVLSKLMNLGDRSTCVLFGDGAGAAILERVENGGFLAFELGADGSGGPDLYMPAGGSRIPSSAESVARGEHYVHMNGRQVFKFATRMLVSSAERVLEQCGLSIEDVDVYVPHQANVRIIDHAVARLGIPEDRVIVNVDRYGNTSSASIPMALSDALSTGRMRKGDTVLMTGMGAGLTWGSAVMEWTEEL